MNWDSYFHTLCYAVSKKSPCLSRRIGAILVRDNSIVSTGYNGPSRGIPHCNERVTIDENLRSKILEYLPEDQFIPVKCPRRLLGYKSSEGMEYCPAQHAEENAVSNAARIGASTIGTTLYMNSIIPCQKCLGTLINAGVGSIVVEETIVYDQHTQFLIDNSTIHIRSFEL